jgi:hypothetical protein
MNKSARFGTRKGAHVASAWPDERRRDLHPVECVHARLLRDFVHLFETGEVAMVGKQRRQRCPARTVRSRGDTRMSRGPLSLRNEIETARQPKDVRSERTGRWTAPRSRSPLFCRHHVVLALAASKATERPWHYWMMTPMTNRL